MAGHLLIRTSPKGQKFLGKCSLCGKENLSIAEATDGCSVPELDGRRFTELADLIHYAADLD